VSQHAREERGLRIPAVILAEPGTAALKIAALSLLDRLIVAAHRAGASSITIVTGQSLPPLQRSRAWGIPFEVAAVLPEVRSPVLVLTTGLLVQTADLRRCLEARARLTSADGTPLPAGMANQPGETIETMLLTAPAIPAEGVACCITDQASARAAEKALWATMTSASDGMVDRHFNRPCGRPLSKWLIHTPVTPNLISLASILIGLIAAWMFALPSATAWVMGAALFQLSAIVDCVDGDVARIVFKESPLGKWLDLAGDQVVHSAVFAGIAWGVMKATGSSGALWLGGCAIAGALISFGVVLRGMRRKADDGGRLQRLIDAATNRDFSVVVLALACFQRLDWFLWMAAIGSHFFWIITLGLQLALKPSRRFAQ